MKQEKSFLGEVASNQESIKASRSEPIQQESQPRQTMDFIRSLILDIPVQDYKETESVQPISLEETKDRCVDDQQSQSIAQLQKLAGIK